MANPPSRPDAAAAGRGALEPEDLTDAFIDGDRTVRRGTARAALRSAPFRRVYAGSLVSNVGTWMQNLILAALALELTDSARFVSVVTLAQLGPLLALSLVGGSLADRFDRRSLLIVVAVQQALGSLALAVVVAADEPSRAAIVAIVLFIGIGQAVHAPTFTASVPALVPREDLLGAVSLQSASMNASRVVGPAIGGVLYETVGPSWVFVGNAATYLFIIAALLSVRIPRPAAASGGPTGIRRLVEGLQAAGRDRPIARCLITMALFSFFCLPFVAQFPTFADRNLGLAPGSTPMALLYATFGAGALAGALSIGTVLAGRALASVARIALAGFAVLLAALALQTEPAPAFPVAFALGFAYFAAVTSLSSVVQQRVDDETRGRVMALWIMSFGGTVPLGAFAAGPVIDATSMTTVMLAGAVVAGALVAFADLRDPASAPGPTDAGGVSDDARG